MFSEIVWDAGTITMAGAFAIPLAAIIGGTWYKLEKAKSDNRLKQRMVERGMSAEEIERVLAAKGAKED